MQFILCSLLYFSVHLTLKKMFGVRISTVIHTNDDYIECKNIKMRLSLASPILNMCENVVPFQIL